MKTVAVVGGGISGLAAALTLSRSPSIDVKLFEANERLGGVLHTVRTSKYLVESSADNFATLIPDALQLAQDHGCSDQLVQPSDKDRRAFVVRRGRLLPIPIGFSLMQPTRLTAMLTTNVLSWRGRLRVLAEAWVAARRSDQDESLESFATRRLGREAFQRLVEPIVGGIFTADPSTLSMQATLSQFLKMEREHGGLIRGYWAARRQDAAAVARRATGARYDQFRAPRAGMSAWVGQLADQLPDGTVLTGSPVRSLRPLAGHRWEVSTDEDRSEFDGVIIALPAAACASLLSDVHPQAAEIIGGVPYASSVMVAMIVNRRDLAGRVDGFGVITPSVEGRQALAISYTSNKYPDRVPDDEILLRIFLGGALRPEVIGWDDDRLLSVAAREIRELLGWTGDAANWQHVFRWPNAMPQYLVGHAQRMQELDRQLATLPSLRVCGAAYRGVGIPQCVRGGRQAAEQIAAYLQPGD